MVDLAIALGVTSAALALVGGIGAICARRLMRAVASLALLFIGLAGLFGSLGAPYLAAAQLFLFVGGVVTLLALAFGSTTTPVTRGTFFITTGIALVGILIGTRILPTITDAGTSVTPAQLAQALFVTYAPALEVALLIILSAVIGVGYLLSGEREQHDGGNHR
jgi:NADH-quinone oxidoreductase subunit J